MATVAVGRGREDSAAQSLRVGTWIMGAAAVGFIGYAVLFFVRNFTDSFLELGIGSNEVDVGKEEIAAFSPSLFHYVGHLHIAVAGFIAATRSHGSARWWRRSSVSPWRCPRTIRTRSTRSATSA